MSASSPVITLDGPSGAGKGTLASALASELGWSLLDSGSLYRLVALCALREQLDDACGEDHERAVAIARGLSIHFFPVPGGTQRIELEGMDVTDDIRTDEVSQAASRWASRPEIRQALLVRQREFAKPPGLVADGRDMGTVIFPNADLKFYVTASAEERARRRWTQLSQKGVDAGTDRIYHEILERDRRDESRASSPLKPAADAHVIDTTGDSVAASLHKIRELVAKGGWGV